MTNVANVGKLGLDADINSSFTLGDDIAQYQSKTWYYPSNLTTGSFSASTLHFSDFYGKQPNDPAIPGSVTFTSSGSFVIPLYRNTLKIELWGAGGGGGSGYHDGTVDGNDGGSTNVLGIIAGGGGKGFGGYRYGNQNGAGGSAGVASGTIANATVLTKTTGNAGTAGNAGGNLGGTGGAAPNGGASGSGGDGGSGGGGGGATGAALGTTSEMGSGVLPGGRTSGFWSGNAGYGGSGSGANNAVDGLAVIQFFAGGLSVKDSGVWQNVNTTYIKDSGDWKEVQGVYVKQNGIWQLTQGVAPITFSAISGYWGLQPR